MLSLILNHPKIEWLDRYLPVFPLFILFRPSLDSLPILLTLIKALIPILLYLDSTCIILFTTIK